MTMTKYHGVCCNLCLTKYHDVMFKLYIKFYADGMFTVISNFRVKWVIPEPEFVGTRTCG